jgi:Cdc6-like AAA superfamily ATPase
MKQKTALGLLRAGHNIFLTGEPGAGKTHTITLSTAHFLTDTFPNESFHQKKNGLIF